MHFHFYPQLLLPLTKELILYGNFQPKHTHQKYKYMVIPKPILHQTKQTTNIFISILFILFLKENEFQTSRKNEERRR